jgi:hypothetical protein
MAVSALPSPKKGIKMYIDTNSSSRDILEHVAERIKQIATTQRAYAPKDSNGLDLLEIHAGHFEDIARDLEAIAKDFRPQEARYPDVCHPTHKTRVSIDASSYDEICDICGCTDIAGGGWGLLRQPCLGWELAAEAEYDKVVAHAETMVHSNRMPAWSELTEEQKIEYLPHIREAKATKSGSLSG